MPLDRLWPNPDDPPPAQDRNHPMVTRSRDQQNQQNQGSPEQRQRYSPTPRDRSQRLNIGSRVVFYNKKGNAIHGTVRWTGLLSLEGGMQVEGVGIETVW